MRKNLSILVLFLSIASHLFSQNIGIGTTAPLEKLHVAGNIKADTVKPSAVKLTSNAGVGKVLTSDAAGNASWQERSAGTGVGFGSWGDCSMNGLSEYEPVADATVTALNFFGQSVAISGNYAIVGAYADDIGTIVNCGSASIYQYNGSSWVFMQKLIDSTGAGGDWFGYSVSLSGNFAIVGAYGDDVGVNTNQGSVSIFQYNGSSWVLMQKISDISGAVGDFFGYSVSLSGNFAIVGAVLDDIGVLDQGSVSIYQYNGSSWVLMQQLYDFLGGAYDNFGTSVSISGNYAIIGAPSDDELYVNQGSATVYHYSGSVWVLMQKITDANGAVDDYFGGSVSISGNFAIISAYADDIGVNTNQGSASIYQFSEFSWILMQKLIDPAGAASDSFGFSVSISGNYAIVGAYTDDVGSISDQGSATIYLRIGPIWQKLKYVTEPMGNQNDQFGNSVSFDSSRQGFLVGASGYANYSGKAVFGKVN